MIHRRKGLSKVCCDELDRIASQSKGILHPKDIIRAARSPKSPLHSRFTWDNTKAAHLWRLEQARHLIRVYVTVIPGIDKPVQTYCSLSEDRVSGGGYRTTVRVLSAHRTRMSLLRTALSELTRIQLKYQSLVELAGVFKELNKLKKKYRRLTRPQ